MRLLKEAREDNPAAESIYQMQRNGQRLPARAIRRLPGRPTHSALLWEGRLKFLYGTDSKRPARPVAGQQGPKRTPSPGGG